MNSTFPLMVQVREVTERDQIKDFTWDREFGAFIRDGSPKEWGDYRDEYKCELVAVFGDTLVPITGYYDKWGDGGTTPEERVMNALGEMLIKHWSPK